MHEPLQNLVPATLGFGGAAVMMTYLRKMPTHHWVSALVAGPSLAYLGSDMVVHFLQHTFPWMPTSEEDVIKLNGLIGAVIGMSSIFIVGAVATLGKRFAANPEIIK